MEERIIDDEDARLVKIKRTKNGDDVVEDAREQAENDVAEESAPDDDFTVEFPDDGEYDEDLVGLTPAQLKEELERRERMKREAQERRDECVSAGKECFEGGDLDGAAENFALALTFVDGDEEAELWLWKTRTEQYPELNAYFKREFAEEFAFAPDAVREQILKRDGEKLKAERARLDAEIEPLKQTVLQKQTERREPLLAHKNYYRLRLCVLLALVACFGIACAVSGFYTVRTTSIAPIVMCAVFGGCAAVCLIVAVFFMRFTLVAARLFAANENLASTEDGRALLDLQERRECLTLVLGDVETDDEE